MIKRILGFSGLSGGLQEKISITRPMDKKVFEKLNAHFCMVI
jgi:hypothetical protein